MLIALRRRLRAARAAREAGVTLTELIVSMTLSVILGAMTLSIFVYVSDSTAATTDRTINTASARNALLAWTSYLRVADGPTKPGTGIYRFEWLTGSDILFHSNLYNRPTSGAGIGTTGPPTLVWLRLDGNNALVEELFADKSVTGALPQQCRILIDVATTALFEPYDSAGHSMAGQTLGTAPSVSKGCQRMPSYPSQWEWDKTKPKPNASAVQNLQNVTTVLIDFTVGDRKHQHTLDFRSSATLPILGGSS